MPSYVIVGASRGLGYEWLRYLSSQPENTVIGLARTIAPVAAQLSADKITSVHLIQADMADNASLVVAAAEAGKITNGSLDYLIVNGCYSDTATTQISPTSFIGQEDLLRKDMITSLEVNILGLIYSVNAFLPLVRKGSVKKITAISTGMADLESNLASGNSGFLTYSTIKAALNMVVVKYANELKPEGITIVALSPGLVNTRTTPPTPEEMKGFVVMLQQMQTRYPNFQGPITPAESVRHQKKVIEEFGIEKSGSFVSHWGNKEWL